MRASIVLTPAESKRLIAKAIVQNEDVKKAMDKAYVILCEGSTNVMIAQELFGLDVVCQKFTCGTSGGGILCISEPKVRSTFPLVAYKGKIIDISFEKALEDFHMDTVIIKGGSAIDNHGLVGVIVSGYDGGVLPKLMGVSVSQGIKIICPIGLEKTVFSVQESAKHTGGKRFDYSMGADYGLFVVSNAEVITEIEAIKILSGASATHIASGGIGGSEGAVILSCEGHVKEVAKVTEIIENIKGEPAQQWIKQQCNTCRYVNCTFYGKEKKSLPEWML